MTGRERLVAAGRGGHVSPKPVLVWPSQPGETPDPRADGWVVDSHDEAASILAAHPDLLVLVTVLSPLGQDLAGPKTLLKALADDPAEGETALEACADQTRRDIAAALEAGADGVVYCLAGAYPSCTTPMEYGGHFLEVDRAILSEAAEARFNVLWVRGKDQPYLDFVIDLPAHAFAWDMTATGMAPGGFRSARNGAIGGAHPDADIFLVHSFEAAEAWLASPEATK